MMKKIFTLGILSVLLSLTQATAEVADHISQYGITWTFDKAYPIGQFCTGDYWVVGPVNVIQITTDLHAQGFTPKPGEDGSMVNPGTDIHQGYSPQVDLKTYQADLNASLVGGEPISAGNPLILKTDSSLVSMVNWLYKSEKEVEPGAPVFIHGFVCPTPRSGAVLTVLPKAPPEGSFRPPYCGNDK